MAEIGGHVLNPGNYSKTSDSLINAVAPEQSGDSQPVIVKTAEGESDGSVLIEIPPSVYARRAART
jgi:hypothetical protein